MSRLSLLAATFALACATQAWAGDGAEEHHAPDMVAEFGVVIEYYTAQGCVACPPVDAHFATLADRPDVIALALHVDYWDYIGWKDRFAKAAFTERQRAYARRAGSNTIYTPQMIIGGIDRVQGFKPMAVADLLIRHAAGQPTVALRLDRDGIHLDIGAEADPPLGHEVSVQIVRYKPAETMRIESGENSGRRNTFRNIVTSWKEIGRWNGEDNLSLRTTAEGSEPIVVILQQAGHGAILAAGRLR